jgi:hypothetical protein
MDESVVVTYEWLEIHTICKIDQVQLLGRAGVLESFEPQLSSTVCMSSGHWNKLCWTDWRMYIKTNL